MVDLVTFGETPLRISPPPSERMELTREANLYADGIESNVAVAAATLGSDATWLSKVPDTAVARNVVRQIEATGVEPDVTFSGGEYRQGITFRESGVVPREHANWHDRQQTAAATAVPGEFPMGTVQEADVLFSALSTAVLSQTAQTTTEAVLRASGGGGAVTALQIDYTPGLASPNRFREAFEQFADEIDLLVADENSVNEVLDERGGPRELTNTLSAVYDLQIVVVGRSDGGAVAMHDTPGTNVIHERETVETESVDPTGNRGAFTGALLHELIQGADAARSLNYAVAAGALCETIPGPFLNTSTDEIERVVDVVREQSQ